jgi:hypothetical protein
MKGIRAAIDAGTLVDFTQDLRSVFSPPKQALMP